MNMTDIQHGIIRTYRTGTHYYSVMDSAHHMGICTARFAGDPAAVTCFTGDSAIDTLGDFQGDPGAPCLSFFR